MTLMNLVIRDCDLRNAYEVYGIILFGKCRHHSKELLPVTMKNISFIKNQGNRHTSAVGFLTLATCYEFNMEDVLFMSNKGVLVILGMRNNIARLTLVQNRGAGTIYAVDDSETTVTQLNATENKHRILFIKNSEVSIADSLFSGNRCKKHRTKERVLVYGKKSNITVQNSQFLSNHCDKGVFRTVTSDLRILNSSFLNNTVKDTEDVISSTDGNVTLEGVIFDDNNTNVGYPFIDILTEVSERDSI